MKFIRKLLSRLKTKVEHPHHTFFYTMFIRIFVYDGGGRYIDIGQKLLPFSREKFEAELHDKQYMHICTFVRQISYFSTICKRGKNAQIVNQITYCRIANL